MRSALRFLDLPAELRNKIYYYTLELCIVDTSTRGAAYEPPLRHTCRQICAETELMYLHALDTQADAEEELAAAKKEQASNELKAYYTRLHQLQMDVLRGIAGAEATLSEYDADGKKKQMYRDRYWAIVDTEKKRERLLKYMLARCIAFG